MFDKFREECALVGVWNVAEAANIAYLGLYAQQHRGQEGVGLVSVQKNNGSKFSIHKGEGLVADVFSNYDFNKLPGNAAIGHVRYTTAGASDIANVQPFYSQVACGQVAVAHNGNLVDTEGLRQELIDSGSIFNTSSDTEIILHLLAHGKKHKDRSEILIDSLQRIKGAFSLVILFGDRLFAVRDPNGFRPLCIGRLGTGYVVASETCALDLIGAQYIRDVKPGEVVEISDTKEKIKSYFPFGVRKETPCIFEYVYFARPDSSVFERNVYNIRKRLGEILAEENGVDADLVVPVPDSGVPAALGYSAKSGIPFEFGLIRNHYVGRTFIEPQQEIRSFGVKIKLNPNPGTLKGKKIIVVDDSIVRGTTSKKLIEMMRAAGAKEIHMRISAPPTIDPCYYGIDTPSKEELIAANSSVDDIAKFINVDSLAYLSQEGLYKAVQAEQGTFCDACFTGNYPIEIGQHRKAKQESLTFSI